MHVVPHYDTFSSFWGFLNLFLHHNIYFMLGEPFLLGKCLFFFCFACLTSASIVVHSSVVCLYVPWYWQNFFLLCPSSESSSSELSKVTAFLFLDPLLLFLLFLEGLLGGIDFSKFSILVLKNSAIEVFGMRGIEFPWKHHQKGM